MTWKEYAQNWKRNFRNGYQFGDFFRSLFGKVGNIDANTDTVQDLVATQGNTRAYADSDATSSQDEVAGGFGSFLNNLTGVTASQGWQTREREAAQAYATSEREAGQQFTHEENELARGWQERMSNTAIQRQVADAKAAGINPYYLFGAGNADGAGVPVASGNSGSATGASAVSAPGSGNSAAAVASAVNSLTNLFGTIVSVAAKVAK